MSGYVDCACRDCMNIAIGEWPSFCFDCIEADCDEGRHGGECQAEHAYGVPCADPKCCTPEDYPRMTPDHSKIT